MNSQPLDGLQNREITIKLAQPTDSQGIVMVLDETWLATYPNESHGITRADIEAKVQSRKGSVVGWQKALGEDRPNEQVWIAKIDNGEVVGVCKVIRKEQVGVVQVMYVLPKFQGKGIGKKLFTEALNWLGMTNSVSLTVVEYNVGAIAFYKTFGFVEAGLVPPEPIATLPSGKIMPEIKMVRAAQE